ncbi:glycosyltransferase [Methylocystis heyeri]|uniref:Glycosyltransferase n=1 Tax=Methylocystis heyeri TaxID=391905 RepID=A0A6B8KM00_9HYPH|nr:glycosyltransferase [Methylocystis heyeri]QGM47858.1 glycosyltransferase [Methylocystis heyeri]
MLVFDLVLATRRKAMTGVERYGVHLFKAVSAIRPDTLAFVRDAEGFDPKLNVVQVPDIYRSWLMLPRKIARLGVKPEAVIFPTAPASPLFRATDMRLCRIIHDAFPWNRERAMPWKGRLLYRDVENFMARRYDTLLGTTEPVAKELQAQLNRQDIVAVGNAPGVDLDTASDAEIPGLPREFVLAVGTVEPRKNYDRLLSVVESGDAGALPVVLVGRPGWGEIAARVEEAARRRPERLIWLQNLNDDGALVRLYRQARCFVSLSRAEGFNMPLVESAMCGCAVVCSDLPIHREVAPPWARFITEDASQEEFWKLVGSAAAPAHDAVEAYKRRFGWGNVASRLLELLGEKDAGSASASLAGQRN